MMNPYKKTWLDYLDPDKSTMKKKVFIKGTPPEIIEEYKKEMELRAKGYHP